MKTTTYAKTVYITKNSMVIFWPFLCLNFIACSWNLLFCHLETGVGCIVRLALLKKAKLFFFQETFFSAKPKYRGWENALFIHKPITRQGKNVNCLKKSLLFFRKLIENMVIWSSKQRYHGGIILEQEYIVGRLNCFLQKPTFSFSICS